MEIEIEIPKIIDETIHPSSTKQPLNQQQHREMPYRWVIIALIGLSLILNGLTNSAVTPLQHKMTQIYEVSQTKVSLSAIINLLVFFIANFPANKIIDSKGLRVGLIIGTALYFAGALFVALVNKSFNFVIIGTILFGLGQPFLLNSPAKIATYWFFPKNRAFATSVMVGISLFGMGIGFLIPTLVVGEDSTGEEAQSAIGRLYLMYFILSGVCLILCLLFMQAGPEIAPSEGATAAKSSSIKESLYQIKRDRNLWKFFSAYCLGYGSLICFATNCNFLIKPYGYSDFLIAMNAVLLIVFGTIAAVLLSIYIKKTYNYQLVLRAVSMGSAILLIILCIWLNSINSKVVTTFIITLMGAVITPTVPICYDLGCEISFPMGEAQVTGLLNGGAMLWAFLSSLFVASVFGYGSTGSSMLIMAFLSIFVILSAVIFSFVKIDLKRRNYEIQQKQPASSKKEVEMTQIEEETANSSRSEGSRDDSGASGKKIVYDELVEEGEVTAEDSAGMSL